MSQVAPQPSAVVASYTSYEDAQRAIDLLADRNFPVDQLTIVAGDLRFVEQVTGRRGYGGAMLEGAASGALTGALLGFILGIFTLITPLASGFALAFWGLVFGAIMGGIAGLIVHAFAGGRHDFSSVRRFEAGRYEVMAATAVAERARQQLHELPRPAAA